VSGTYGDECGTDPLGDIEYR
jgi:hypothetical protein